ncbi:MAG: hypothetical protein RRC07_09520, partial [Anaerolineae bacterium]|nr:hypothetical protein [Anaerolineae bacterium]
MKISHLLLLLLVALVAVACGDAGSGAQPVSGEIVTANSNTPQPAAAEAGENSAPPAPVTVVTDAQEPAPAAGNSAPSLTTGYPDALTVSGQLALGTLQLEETDLAVSEDQAVALLPLWQALQSLSVSDTTAPAELEAIVRQVSQTMTPAQIEAIQTMQLTNESITELGVELGVGFGRFAGRGAGQSAGAEQGLGPGGGIPGTGAGGGMGRGFGGGATATGEVDEVAMATRQAERESGAFQEQALTVAVVRLLQTKTGEAPQNGT